MINEYDIRPFSFHLMPKRKEVYIKAHRESDGKELTFRSDRF